MFQFFFFASFFLHFLYYFSLSPSLLHFTLLFCLVGLTAFDAVYDDDDVELPLLFSPGPLIIRFTNVFVTCSFTVFGSASKLRGNRHR